MPRIKYFQPIADIRNDYQDRLNRLNSDVLKESVTILHGNTPADIPALESYIDAMNYLLSYETGYSRVGKPLHQPDYPVFEALFTEQRDTAEQRLASIRDRRGGSYAGLKALYRKQRDCAEYYLEKLKDPVFLKKWPKVIEPL